MTGYFLRIEIEEGRVREIMDRLTAAQKEIYACYRELEDLGVVTLKKKPTAATDGFLKERLIEMMDAHFTHRQTEQGQTFQ